MKNPNGYGSVVKLSGNRRRPFAVRKTTGFNEKGHPIYLCIGYTETREEGMILLAEYNRSPYSVEDRNITVKGVYEKWIDFNKGKMTDASYGSFRAAWKHCTAVYNESYRTLKSLQVQSCIDNCPRSYSTKGAIKNLFNHLDRYAMEIDLIDRPRCLLVTAPSAPETTRVPFTNEEITTLWEHSGEEWVDTVLIFIYTGMRISELLNLKTAAVDFEQETITGGTKTAAGKNRVIPIHPKIMPFIKARADGGNEYLISVNGRKCTSARYYSEWGKLMAGLNTKHTPHECRHTFRSMLDSAGANKRCIDLIMGHRSKDVGERVYTHKTIDELKATILLLD